MILRLGMLPECYDNVTDSSPDANAARELKRVAGVVLASVVAVETLADSS